MNKPTIPFRDSPEALMHTDPGDSAGQDMDVQAEKSLQERPSFSIRAKLMLGFLLFFFLSAGATLMAWYSLHRLEQRLHFLELIDRYTFEIQQARRFEKNFFLYGTNLEEVMEHVEKAQRLLASAKGEIALVIGKADYRKMEQHLDSYRDLVGRTIERDPGVGTAIADPGIENEFRRHGAAMISVALQVASKERSAVQTTFKLLKRLPFVFVVLLLVLTLYMVHFLTRQMLGPLGRLMRTAQRIGRGDFTPHWAVRRFKDEFSNLAMALNRMRRELAHRQEILVESQRLRSLGTLTAGVAHELNNPLSNISSSTQILYEEIADQLSPYHRELLLAIESQILKARDIVRALLEFSREREFVRKPTGIRQVVEDTLKLVKGEVPKNVEIQLDVPERVKLDLDKSRIQQALLNLISNSLQAMENQSRGRLTIRGRERPETDTFVLEIADTGTGIPPEQLPYIFDPFFTTKDVGHGTGLGLSVTYGIVERHGGEVSVQSEVGKGTRFDISFPLHRSKGE